jgi:Na+-transporting methylmalonyl-CoA/oxaloacetate decarboxylase gamma subunit
METSGIVFLVLSALASFGIGRTVMHFRKKSRQKKETEARQRVEQVKREAPPEPESKNKAKRRRQLAAKSTGKR